MQSLSFDEYCQLGIDALLQGEVLEAQGIWFALLSESDRPDELTKILIDRLEETTKQSLSADAIERVYRQILELEPERESAYHGLMKALFEQGNLEEAIACCHYLLALHPHDPNLYNNLGVLLEYQERVEEAIGCYQKTIELDPNSGLAYYNLGHVWQRRGNREAAISCYQTALRLDPQQLSGYYDLAFLYEQEDHWDEAIACCQTLLSYNPNLSKAHNYLGYLLHQKGCFLAAREAFDRALALDATDPEIHFNRALLLLQLGEFEQGWKEFEWRWKLSDRGSYPFSQPLWDGSDLNGKTILLYAEYGYGDTIQFIRYAPRVAQRGGRVIVQIPPDLIPLLQNVPGIDSLTPGHLDPPAFDVHAPLLSLPRILGTTIETIPAAPSYLAPSGRFRLPLAIASQQLKVGIAWAGNPHYRRDRTRSCALTHFLPVLQLSDIAFFSLQKGVRVADLSALPASVTIQEIGSQFNNFADTAAAIAQLDLIITTDTSIAHLAGALGKPTWLLLSFVPDWRWLLDRSNSPWYPLMRLFRQTRPGDWAGVFEQVTIALQEEKFYHSRNNRS